MEPAAHADAELINYFPSFSLPRPPLSQPRLVQPCPQTGESRPRCGCAPLPGGLSRTPPGLGDTGAAPLDGTASLGEPEGERLLLGHSVPSPGHSIPARGSQNPSPARGSQNSFPGAEQPFPGTQHPIPGVQIIPLPGQTATPPAPVTPMCRNPPEHPHPRP